MPDKEYMVAHLLDSIDEFRSWPPHITLLPWMTTVDVPKLEDSFQTVADSTGLITLTTGPLELKDNRFEEVRKIIKTEQLDELHMALLGAAKHIGQFGPKIKHFGRPGYNPHITKHSGISEGDDILMRSFSLIEAEEKRPEENRLKTVIGTFRLG